MPINAVVFPITDRFWSQCAQHLISSILPNEPLAPDFSALQVIVPAYEHAQLLTQALSNELGATFIPPRINTMSAWLAMQIPEPNEPIPISQSVRLMELYSQLREHVWLKNLFSARKDIDLLPLVQTLVTLSDELTQALLPLIFQHGTEQAKQVWDQALATLSSQQILSDEAQLVWQIWSSQLDGTDAISQRFQQMMRLAKSANSPLLWLSPVAPDGLERQFLNAYAKKNPVQIVSLDWRCAGLIDALVSAWPEIAEDDGTSITLPHVELTQISTVVADSLEQEAQAAAQTILGWLQQGKNSIALIAQDRVAARRIRALLERANVYVADETGWKLSTTRSAAALAAWFDVVASRADTTVLLDFLKSPYFSPAIRECGEGKSSWLMPLESILLRANVVGGWDAIIYALSEQDQLVTLIERLKMLARGFSGRKTLIEWLKLTEQTTHEFGMQDQWQQDEAGLQVVQLLEKVRDDCSSMTEKFSFSEWRVFMHLQLENTSLRAEKKDLRVMMLPLNGARLRRFDAVLMVGCDAAHLPSPSREVLFFTNTVRRECGLITREQRQQQQLRDFAELLSVNSEVVLSWQAQQHGEYNPVSPWIERLNLSLQRAGLNRLAIRHVQFTEQAFSSLVTHQPKPTAAALRPNTLSASGYSQLLACPYQFFVERMLGLSSIDVLSDMPEKRDYGAWLHAILKTYHDTLKANPELYPSEKQEHLLREITQTMFSRVLKKSPVALGYRVRWEKTIPAYIQWSQQRAASGWQFEIGEVWLEKKLQSAKGEITLRGQIDRIDKNQNGEYAVLDYKTSSVNKLKKKLVDAEDHQLPFYGLLAEQASMQISAAHYVALELERKKLGDALADQYSSWQQQLQQSIIQHISAIDEQAELPAHGASQVCQYCEVRGLCRKGEW